MATSNDINKSIKSLVDAVTEQNKLVSKMIGAAGPGDAKAGVKPARDRLEIKKAETIELEKQLQTLEKQKHSTGKPQEHHQQTIRKPEEHIGPA